MSSGPVNSNNFEWHPLRIVGGTRHPSWDQFSMVVLNQPIDNTEKHKLIGWVSASFRVAADGGANHLLKAGRDIAGEIDVIIGDLDSFTDESRAFFNALPNPPNIIQDPDQYSTDFGKAVTHIRVLGKPADIVAIGGLGGRVDQGLSQVHHLCLCQSDPGYGQGRMYLVSTESLTFLLKPGRHRIVVREDGVEEAFGKHVGIIPIKGPSVISTKGLEWDVTDWNTEFGGQMSTSNHVLPQTKVVEVETNKDLVFTIALKQ